MDHSVRDVHPRDRPDAAPAGHKDLMVANDRSLRRSQHPGESDDYKVE